MSRKMPIRFESALFAAVVLLHASNLAAQPGRAVLTGSVVVDSLPLPGVEVLLPEHSLQAFTNDSGRFRLSGIPSGSHEIQVRHIGYAPVFLDVVIAPNDSLDRRIVLARVPTLESVDVQASTVLPSFEEHRRMGLGKFLTREDLAKQENRKMSEIVAQFRGIRIYHGMSGRAFIYSGRRPITSITGRRRGAPGERAEGPIDACYAQIFVNEVVV